MQYLRLRHQQRNLYAVKRPLAALLTAATFFETNASTKDLASIARPVQLFITMTLDYICTKASQSLLTFDA
jgi:hypothetical protein